LQMQQTVLSLVKKKGWLVLYQLLHKHIIKLKIDALIPASLIGQLQVLLVDCELIQQYPDGSWCYNSAAFIMEIKHKLMTSIKHLQTPWDPGGID
ncbi:unnamed protein product, partial [Urochloa humidicola]